MWRRVFRPRVLVYSAVLWLIMAGVALSLWLRVPFKVDVVRDRGALAKLVEDGRLENGYRMLIMNATEARHRYKVRVEGLDGIELVGRQELEVEPAQSRWLPLAVQIPAKTAAQQASGAHPIRFVIEREVTERQDAPAVVTEKSTFVIPR